MRRIYHPHPCQCIGLILVNMIHIFLSNQTPIVVIHNTPLPMHAGEVYSSPIINKVPFERHSIVPKENHPSSYNIEEIFGSFTFNLHRIEVSRKWVRKVKQADGNWRRCRRMKCYLRELMKIL